MGGLKKYYFAKKKFQANTIIGGIGVTITSASLLASKLSIPLSSISGFRVISGNIECYINATYNIPSNCFKNDLSITFYNDIGGNVDMVKNEAFREAGNLLWIDMPKCRYICEIGGYLAFYACGSLYSVNLPECISMYTQAFQWCVSMQNYNLPKLQFIGTYALSQNTSMNNLYIPLCTNLGGNIGNNSVLEGVKTGCTITVSVILATNNAGSPDGDLAYAISRGANIIYV